MSVYEEAKDKLTKLLSKNRIDYAVRVLPGGYQIYFGGIPDADVICNQLSYGGAFGLWESYGFESDQKDVTGWMTAEQVVEKVKEEFTRKEKKSASSVGSPRTSANQKGNCSAH